MEKRKIFPWVKNFPLLKVREFSARESCAVVIWCVEKREKTGANGSEENLNLDFSSTASEEQFGKQEKPRFRFGGKFWGPIKNF